MQRNRDARVGIIGAGPSGITAGKKLLQAGGRNFVIYEKGDVPLYLHVFHPDHPSLFFIGLVQPLGSVLA